MKNLPRTATQPKKAVPQSQGHKSEVQDLLEFLIQNIVSHPQDISLKKEPTGETLTFRLRVNPEDLKIVIGKGGRTIKAIRDLLRVKTGRQGKMVNLVLEED